MQTRNCSYFSTGQALSPINHPSKCHGWRDAYGRNPAIPYEEGQRRSGTGILNFVGLGNKIEILASQLTMAERKRLELARALAAHPQLLLLDELMAGLNSAETETR